jgi:hypothetical protein
LAHRWGVARVFELINYERRMADRKIVRTRDIELAQDTRKVNAIAIGNRMNGSDLG